MRKNKNNQRGFIALISVVIISVILLLVAVTLSTSGFYGRYDILDSELKDHSTAIADACVDNTLLQMANDPNFAGNATTTIGTDTCYVGLISASGTTDKVFKTRSMYKNYYTNLKIEVNTSNLSLVSWQEITTQ